MRRSLALPVLLAFALVFATAGTSTAAGSGPGPKRAADYRTLERVMHARIDSAVRARTVRATSAVVTDNFRVVGHTDLARDTNGDVWVHGDFAYVGTWADPCTGRGVKVIDVSDPANPVMIGRVAGRAGTSAEDVVVRHVSTSWFTGDLLAAGIQRCGDDPALDDQQFGMDFWDVTDPYHPARLGTVGLANGGGGVHELDLFQRGGNVYALGATIGSEWFDPVPQGDFRIVRATNPAHPVQIAHWGAGEHGLARSFWDGLGAFGASFAHSARVSKDKTKAYVSYWDLGVFTFDITDARNPVMIGRTRYPFGSEGEAHSVADYHGSGGDFLLQNDEDFDTRSPARVIVGDRTAGIAAESIFSAPLWLSPGHQISGQIARPSGQGCTRAAYAGTHVAGRIALARTYFGFFQPPAQEPACSMRRQAKIAQNAGALAIVHDYISPDTSPQWWEFEDVTIPVLFTEHATAKAMEEAGRATLRALRPSWGFLRVFDARTGRQVATFDDVPYVHRLIGPPGFWSIHNNEVMGNRTYASWYTNGVVALNLSPLNRATPQDPLQVGQFVPPGARSHSDFVPDGVAVVWGVAVRASDGLIFASDMNGGLWIVRPTGAAAA